MVDPLLKAQPYELKGHQFKMIGDPSILGQKLTGILCSQSCPGELILKAFDEAKQIRDNKMTVISGFHSPIELETFRILIRGTQPLVICLARNIDGYHISKSFKTLIASGQLAIVAPDFSENENRITQGTADLRNELIFNICDQVLLVHATPGGNLDRICTQHLPDQKNIYAIPSERNSHLFEQGVLEWGIKYFPL